MRLLLLEAVISGGNRLHSQDVAAVDAQSLVGRAPEQVDAFIAEVVEPLRAKQGVGLDVETLRV